MARPSDGVHCPCGCHVLNLGTGFGLVLYSPNSQCGRHCAGDMIPTLNAGIPWWPGAQNIGQTATAKADDAKADDLKSVEDDVVATLSVWPTWKRAIAYRWPNASGLSLSTVDSIIRRRTA